MKSTHAANDMTIGELAGQFGLATHVLRHWEAAGLLTPATRVSGRRRYSTEQLIRVAIILRGKQSGFSLEALRAVLDAPDGPTRRSLLQRHHDQLERRIAQAEAQKELLEHALNCPADDFLQCPNFQQIVNSLGVRVPLPTDPSTNSQAVPAPGKAAGGQERSTVRSREEPRRTYATDRLATQYG